MRQGSAGAWATPNFDWSALIANKDAEIARLEGLYRQGLERAGVTLMQARAELADAHTLIVQPGNHKITARIILVATGGRPLVPEVPGVGHAITSNEAFHLERLPKSIMIAGGGYIAVEFAGIFAALGADTTLLYRGPKILRGFDEELRDSLTEELFKRRIDVVCNAEIASIDKGWTQLKVTLKDGSTVDTGAVMFATGRIPNTRGIGLEAAGVALGEKGEMIVDANSRSSVENIYAVGDVTEPRQPHARRHPRRPRLRRYRVRQQAQDRRSRAGADGRVLDARDRHRRPAPSTRRASATRKLDVYKARFRALKHTLAERDERMLMKLLVDGETGRVVGCHVLGADAAEIVQMAAIAMRMGATKADFDATMALHPSAAEELVTMREKWVPPARPAPPKPATAKRG